MNNAIPAIALALSTVAIVFSAFVFAQTEPGREILGLPPVGYAVAKTDHLTFFYPNEDIVFVQNEESGSGAVGFWQRELYDRLIAEGDKQPVSDTMPFIGVWTEEKAGRTLEEFAIEDHGFGDEKKFADIEIFTDRDENFSYGYKMIEGKNVLWVYAHERFEITSYYFEDGEQVHVFYTLFSSDTNLELVESMIETVK